MRSGAEDPHLVDVELVEDREVPPLGRHLRARARVGREPAVPVDAVPVDADGPRRGRRSHARAWSAVGALAVVAVVGWGLNQAEERRDETRLAALAGLPGYLDPIGEPLTVAWRVDAGRPVGRTTSALLVADDTDGAAPGPGLAAVDLGTGVVAWRRAVAGELCVPPSLDGGRELPLVSVVVCLPHASTSAPGVGRVTVLDAATGQEVRSQAVGASVVADVVDGLVLMTSSTADGAVTVRAWDPGSGLDAWEFTAAPLVPASVRVVPGWSHEVDDGVLTFVSGSLRLAFDTATGRRQSAARVGSDRVTLDLPGGREARWAHDQLGRPKDVVIVDRDGGSRFEAPGVPWLAPVRDGSATEVVVIRRTADQHLLGLDAGTGRVLWDLANVPWLEASVQVGGVVVAVSPSAAVALDVGTGLRLWEHDAARGSGTWDVLTDGHVALVPTDDGLGGVVLTARRLTTGEAAWVVPLPGEVAAIEQVDGRTVLVRTESVLVALR